MKPAPDTTAPKPQPWSRTIPLIACVVACGASAYLVILHRQLDGSDQGPRAAGCGIVATGSCDSLLQSDAAYVFGVPVALGAVLFYPLLAILVWRSERKLEQRLYRLALVVSLASSGWFVSIMVQREAFCLFCSVAHGCNLVLAVCWGLTWAQRQPRTLHWPALVRELVVPAVLVWGVLSFASPRDAGYVGQALEPGKGAPSPVADPAGEAEEDTIDLGRLLLAPSGEQEVALFMDFTCEKCAALSAMLTSILDAHPNRIRIALHLFPLEKQCNPAVETQDPQHVGGCNLARLGHAVGIASPQGFEAFHQAVVARGGKVSLQEAFRIANEAVGERTFSEASFRSASVTARLQRDIDLAIDWGVQRLPALVIAGKKYEGTPENVEALRASLAPLLSADD